jgi:hypothetical protein
MASSKASTNRLRRPRQLVPGMCGLAVLVVAPPALDDDLRVAESVEDFAVEQLIAQASVGALDV